MSAIQQSKIFYGKGSLLPELEKIVLEYALSPSEVQGLSLPEDWSHFFWERCFQEMDQLPPSSWMRRKLVEIKNSHPDISDIALAQAVHKATVIAIRNMAFSDEINQKLQQVKAVSNSIPDLSIARLADISDQIEPAQDRLLVETLILISQHGPPVAKQILPPLIESVKNQSIASQAQFLRKWLDDESNPILDIPYLGMPAGKILLPIQKFRRLEIDRLAQDFMQSSNFELVQVYLSSRDFDLRERKTLIIMGLPPHLVEMLIEDPMFSNIKILYDCNEIEDVAIGKRVVFRALQKAISKRDAKELELILKDGLCLENYFVQAVADILRNTDLEECPEFFELLIQSISFTRIPIKSDETASSEITLVNIFQALVARGKIKVLSIWMQSPGFNQILAQEKSAYEEALIQTAMRGHVGAFKMLLARADILLTLDKSRISALATTLDKTAISSPKIAQEITNCKPLKEAIRRK